MLVKRSPIVWLREVLRDSDEHPQVSRDDHAPQGRLPASDAHGSIHEHTSSIKMKTSFRRNERR